MTPITKLSIPEGISCHRGTFTTGITYDAEIYFGQYGETPNLLVSTGHKSHEEAKTAAQAVIASPVHAAMLQILQEKLGHLKVAKP